MQTKYIAAKILNPIYLNISKNITVILVVACEARKKSCTLLSVFHNLIREMYFGGSISF
jgi:hypothetical protein